MHNSINNFFEHLRIESRDRPEIKALKTSLMLKALESHFEVTTAKLNEMVFYMLHEMHVGLENEGEGKKKSSLRMVPSFVYHNPPLADGTFYALDLGGTNFRVVRMVMKNGRLIKKALKSYAIPKEHMEGNAESLFGFIADCVHDFNKSSNHDSTQRTKLGFTFSFPIEQSEINKGILVKWTKGFTANGVVGKDVCQLLQQALDKRGSNMDVVALCNDTVGTQVARYFTDCETELGVIIGTGTNGAYWERSNRIIKNPKIDKGKLRMSISTEFGNFDSDHAFVLPRNGFDHLLDIASNNPSSQLFEKMVSGMYLGEIARIAIISLCKANALPRSFLNALEERPYQFTTKDIGIIASDMQPGYPLSFEILRENYNIKCEKEDIELVRKVCQLVVKRSARLGAMAIAGLLLKSNKTSNVTVAIDGSVFEKVPFYKGFLAKAIKEILGDESNILIVIQKEGSGIGAGYIAALSSKL